MLSIKKISFFMLILLVMLLFNCKKGPSHNDGKLVFITSLFPLFDFSVQLSGGKASVDMLLPPGVEAHSYEPSPRDIIKLNKAQVFIYTNKEMEPWADKVVRSISNKSLIIIRAAQGIEPGNNDPKTPGHKHANQDPHIWLDPVLAQKIIDNISAGLVQADPKNKQFYLNNSLAYKKKLELLHKNIQVGLKSCAQDTIYYGGHFAFGYFGKRYKLKHVSPYKNFAPDAEPAPMDIIAMIKNMKAHRAKYVFYPELVQPRIANVIARETGAKLLLLHGAHNITQMEMLYGASYLFIMEQNLKHLRIGLECK